MGPQLGEAVHADVGRLGVGVPVVVVDQGEAQAQLDGRAVLVGAVAGVQRGWSYEGGSFVSDRAAEPAWTRAELEAHATDPATPVTFTCTPWGSGQRMGIDRDLDGVLDGDETP